MTTAIICEKIDKTAIYALHGIQYDKKTDRILSPLGWIKPLLKKGNTKTGTAVYTYSLLPTNKVFDTVYGPLKGTCPCHCPGCYATTGRYNMPSTINSLALQTKLAYDYLNFVERAIIAQLETLPRVYEIRIHAAGDFFSFEYLNMWKRVIKNFPHKFFWTYTKVKAFEKEFNQFDNANIVKSAIDGIGFNFGPVEYILNTYYKLKAAGMKVYICRCGIDQNQHCHDCHSCSKYDFVLFVEHSTGYNPKTSPRYDELVNVIENQAPAALIA